MMMLAMVMVVLTTGLGKIELQLDQAHAPLTTANFMQYVSDGFFDGGGFFRTVTSTNQSLDKVKIAVIQATATIDFFICIGDQPELDFGGKRNPGGQGFAAFGKVIGGMDIVRKIHQN